MNTMDDLEDSFHVAQIKDNLSKKDREAFEILNSKAPKLLSNFIDLMIMR